ncbi:MAG: hypothetical protein CMB82_11720 [Flammeovirgaceae bacterium]|nr:hypothetical protein [Flammeovirgaceae bacterium]
MGHTRVFFFLLLMILSVPIFSQHSVARQWNEVLLEAIRNDYARPTVHARNLFHISIAMYDAWAVYDDYSQTFFLGKTLGDYQNHFEGILIPTNVEAARDEAISYACYRLLLSRFQISPGAERSLPRFDSLMMILGYDKNFTSTQYQGDSPAALGNYIAAQIIEFGLQDGSNEVFFYSNLHYEPINEPLIPTFSGNLIGIDPNRWQPLAFDFFIDQAGFEVPGGTPDFLSPEWGKVVPFALTKDDLTIKERDGNEYWVYHDPGDPCYLELDGSGNSSEYQWGNSLVTIWSSHLDPNDGVMIDVSPATIGNIDPESYPNTLNEHRQFYNLFEGGDPSRGHDLNPITQEPYEPQIVPRGDYTRVLAEFWADGPDSESPPGHWFTILNYVSDHNQFEKRYQGVGDILNDLEWDVKAYFTLGGAVHDAAISAWGIKGWYDYIRPISAIRYLSDQGQSSNPSMSSYASNGIPLEEGYIELVELGDSLAGAENEHIGKIKLYAWRGPEFIKDPETEVAGVGWILAENWWPYQRLSFVTPPFAGYISGHSTFSRSAAEVMTALTGDAFFPGGIGEFVAKKDEFLHFEQGPSMDITLQWATYQDASDQTSLSRIWGGIHPPVDDIVGRLIGEKIGLSAFNKAKRYFEGTVLTNLAQNSRDFKVYPNPALEKYLVIDLDSFGEGEDLNAALFDMNGRVAFEKKFSVLNNKLMIDLTGLADGIYILRVYGELFDQSKRVRVHLTNE